MFFNQQSNNYVPESLPDYFGHMMDKGFGSIHTANISHLMVIAIIFIALLPFAIAKFRDERLEKHRRILLEDAQIAHRRSEEIARKIPFQQFILRENNQRLARLEDEYEVLMAELARLESLHERLNKSQSGTSSEAGKSQNENNSSDAPEVTPQPEEAEAQYNDQDSSPEVFPQPEDPQNDGSDTPNSPENTEE